MGTKPYIYTLLFITLLFLLPSLNLSLSPPPPPQQRRCYPDDERALLQIKAYFGSNLSMFSTWTSQNGCCNKWSGVLCKKIPKTNIHRVNFLEIIGSDEVVGTIPTTLNKLPYLETLILRLLPNLTGPIPPVIGNLTRLTYLSLNWDGLNGPIPNFLSQLTNLVVLSLNNNRFTGSIPAFLGQLPKLQGVDLQENQLTGRIPETFGLFANDSQINLYNNKLSGTIPKSLGKINFESLDLSGNQLIGDASFLFGEDKSNLAHLILSRNRLSFDFSKVVMPVGQLNSSLSVLELSHNQIYGSLPTWLG
ncbi:polygalacturonase inhibitor-like [Chenopodium quinoa]|uniref:polygalacturonase inhibitor-like n=1 Tax=Chenopodium quinoa TaxID=63459 RepID=UPI000B77801E|nr:polygalacturonase inhibitor-like [Chenopodium quinoa]